MAATSTRRKKKKSVFSLAKLCGNLLATDNDQVFHFDFAAISLGYNAFSYLRLRNELLLSLNVCVYGIRLKIKSRNFTSVELRSILQGLSLKVPV